MKNESKHHVIVTTLRVLKSRGYIVNLKAVQIKNNSFYIEAK